MALVVLLILYLLCGGCHGAGTALTVGTVSMGNKAEPQPACIWAILPVDGATLAECRDLVPLVFPRPAP